MSDNADSETEDYHQVGSFSALEANRLLAALESRGVDFLIETSACDPVAGDLIGAAYGGSFGSSRQVTIFVRVGQVDRFMEIHDEAFIRQEPPKDHRSLLKRIRDFGKPG